MRLEFSWFWRGGVYEKFTDGQGGGAQILQQRPWVLADLGREAAAGGLKVSQSWSLDTQARLVQPISFQESLCFRDFGGISDALALPHLFAFKRRVFR